LMGKTPLQGRGWL